MEPYIPYVFEHLPIPGGGYVTGFLFSEKNPDILYIRTDIGGLYRFSFLEKRWHSLSAHVSMEDLSETYPAAIALEEASPQKLYMICGTGLEKSGYFVVSHDGGASFTRRPIPTPVHGNWPGRGTGYRLVSDAAHPGTLYYASQRGGLLRTRDEGFTWEELFVAGEKYMTLVWLDNTGTVIVAGCAGLTNSENGRRGPGLYVSYDAGVSFRILPMPDDDGTFSSSLRGFVPQRTAFDGQFLFVTISCNGDRPYPIADGYSCDAGEVKGGRVLRYKWSNGRFTDCRDVTPIPDNISPSGYPYPPEGSNLPFGFSGISVNPLIPGLVVCSTICKMDGDMLFLSLNYGDTWTIKLHALTVGSMQFKTPYMKPMYNGNNNLIHWMSDVKINPFRPDELWFNTGTGVFATEDLLSEVSHFSDVCEGLEETVHLAIYSLPSKSTCIIDIVGDLGGFAFTDITKPCENTFADAEGNRYITCLNADFSDYMPNTLIVTPRGNWTGQTRGGLILSKDYGKTFTRLPMPYGLSEHTDTLLHGIEQPDVNSGWAAISSDCKSIVWTLAEQYRLPSDCVLYSHDCGNTFALSRLSHDKVPATALKVFSDRVNPLLMYGFADNSCLYISRDGGAVFQAHDLSGMLPACNLGIIFDIENKTEIRAESGKEGVLYLALGKYGLYKLHYDTGSDQISLQKLSVGNDEFYCIGLGILRENGNYFEEDKALYVYGKIKNTYGFYRSLDDGATWSRLNTNAQMYGDIHSIDGDCKQFGVFYIATGSMGALVGTPL